jgi:uncharacterized membrane protein YdcZ (DUF606 family)
MVKTDSETYRRGLLGTVIANIVGLKALFVILLFEQTENDNSSMKYENQRTVCRCAC